MSGVEKIESYFNLQNITWNAITIKFWTKTKKVSLNNQKISGQPWKMKNAIFRKMLCIFSDNFLCRNILINFLFQRSPYTIMWALKMMSLTIIPWKIHISRIKAQGLEYKLRAKLTPASITPEKETIQFGIKILHELDNFIVACKSKITFMFCLIGNYC